MSEYDIVADFYEGKVAERSGLPYINHINEGLLLLAVANTKPIAKRAFCLHPLIQGHSDFEDNKEMLFEWGRRGREYAEAAMLALEYRNVANQYTSRHPLKSPKDIYLSPLHPVNHMLAADKIQNYKDAIDYVIPKHPEDARRLHEYFQSWLDALGISKEDFDVFCKLLRNNFPYNHDADSFAEVRAYYEARFATLWDYEVTQLKRVEGGVEAYIKSTEGPPQYYISFYVYKSARGAGMYRKWAKTLCGGDRVLTLHDCNLADALTHMGVPHTVVR